MQSIRVQQVVFAIIVQQVVFAIRVQLVVFAIIVQLVVFVIIVQLVVFAIRVQLVVVVKVFRIILSFVRYFKNNCIASARKLQKTEHFKYLLNLCRF